jgi:hypothetical protein
MRDHDVLEENGRWIFRFPRRPEVEEWLAKEIALLPELAPGVEVDAAGLVHSGLAASDLDCPDR